MDQNEILMHERAEAMRVGNLLAAAVQACFYALDDQESPPFPPESAFSPIVFKKISGPQAEMLQKHTGWATVHIVAPDPVYGWIPARMTFHVSPAFLQEWKRIVVGALNATYEQLRAVLEESDEEEEIDESEETEEAEENDGLTPELRQKMREAIEHNIRASKSQVPAEAEPAPVKIDTTSETF